MQSWPGSVKLEIIYSRANYYQRIITNNFFPHSFMNLTLIACDFCDVVAANYSGNLPHKFIGSQLPAQFFYFTNYK